MLRQSWEKYSLIVIGNIVFFALLYFISYRPNNDENRATEFLSMAQSEETNERYEAALVLYMKVINSYPDTRAAITATSRLPRVKKLVALPPRKEPELVAPRLDLESMLTKRPSVYLATFLAKHYRDDPSQTPKIRSALFNYLKVASNHEGVDVATLRSEPEFQSEFFRREFFSLKPRCSMDSDWFYDDFYIENTNFFPWNNVHIQLTVKQGDEQETAQQRLTSVAPGEKLRLLEFRVRTEGGVVECSGELTTASGKATWNQSM